MDSTMQAVLQFVEENDVKFIRLAFCDVMGTLKNIAIMPSELPRAFETGVSFDASSILGFAPVDKSDLFLFPDAATLSVLPWRPQTGRVVRFFCSVRTADGSPYGADGRHILRRTLRRLADDVPAVVGGAIVDEEHLVADVGSGEDLGQPLGHFGDILRFVVGGEDDGEKRFNGQGARLPFG